MADQELTSLSITQAVENIRKGELSPVDLTSAFLNRIEQIDPQLNSFITVVADRALERAKWAEEQLAQVRRGLLDALGPLHGIPIALKDLYQTKSIRTTIGARFQQDYVPDEDAFTVQKLEQAGAVILGKTNMHEIALGLTNVNPHFGACRNPWALDRIPGGSSGGSGAALAANLCMGSLGSDTGGSIRVPASLCGIVGLKPTYGRVSLRGVFPLSWNLDHAGPMARIAADVALLLQVIAGYDPNDPYCIDMPVPNYLQNLPGGIAGWRFALVEGDYFQKTTPEIHDAVNQAAQVIPQLGANVESVNVDDLISSSARASGLMVISDAAAVHEHRLQNTPHIFGDDVRERLQAGAAVPSTDYILARRAQIVNRWEFVRFFESFDMIILPTTPIVASPIDGSDALEQARLLTRYTSPFNLTGLPAISLPCGFTAEGLPIGLQLIARPWAEERLLQAAFAYESATSWYKRTPEL